MCVLMPCWLSPLRSIPPSKAKAALKATEEGAEAAPDTLDFRDTFLDAAHVRASFPAAQVTFAEEGSLPPYRLSFGKETVHVESYRQPNPGPYPKDQPKAGF